MESVRADERLGLAINGYLNHYITLSDGKAGAVAGASLVLVGIAISPSAQVAVPFARWLGVLAAVAAAGFAMSVIFPRTPHFGRGHIFWGDIRHFDSATSYWKSMSELSPDAIGLELARQNYNVSGVLLRKIAGVRRSIALFGASCISLTYAFGAA